MPSQDVSIKGEGTSDFAEVHVDVDTSEKSVSVKGNIYGWDEDGSQWLKLLCDENGRLITSAFTRPADTLDIGENFGTDVDKNDNESSSYTIPDTKEWRLLKFGGGGFTDQGRVTIDFDGTIIREIFVSGDSFEVTIDEAYEGDGVKEITLTMYNNSNVEARMFSYFTGFEQ